MRYSYCPYCGSKYNNSEDNHFYCDACNKHVWLNSKPTASTLITNEKNQLLLGKRGIEPFKGKWDIIGGFLHYGEHPEHGAIREAREETGLEVELAHLLPMFTDIYDEDTVATLNISYIAKVIGGTEKANDDVAELRWFDADSIPSDLAFACADKMVATWKDFLQTSQIYDLENTPNN
jgi:ADP-ribose pyrophosphatase YjhB (NUDIX family)